MFKRRPRYSMEEFERRGAELYETKLRAKVETGNLGRLLFIDIESGDYALADDELEGAQVLIDKNPDAQIWCLRIGHVAVSSYCGFPSREKKR